MSLRLDVPREQHVERVLRRAPVEDHLSRGEPAATPDRDQTGKLIRWGTFKKQTLFPGRLVKHTVRLRLGLASSLPAGTYTLRVRFIQAKTTWRSPAIGFRQRY